MKKVIFMFFILMLGCTWLYTKESESEGNEIKENGEELKEEAVYKTETKEFIKVTATELIENKLETPAYLYVGRKTCPYCREFVRQLSGAVKKSKFTIYYLDSEDAKTDKKVQTVGRKFDISGVPCLLRVYATGEFVKYDGNSNEELEDWLELLNKTNN